MIAPRNLLCAAIGIGVVVLVFVLGGGTDRGKAGDETDRGGRGERTPGAVKGSSVFVSGSRPSKSPVGRHGESPGSRKARKADGKQASGGSEPTPAGSSVAKGAAQKLFEKKGVALFNESYGLNEEIAQVLGLGESDIRGVTQTLSNTLEEVDKLREQSMEVRSRSDSQLFLKIRSFGEKGAEVRAAMQSGLREQLGEERYAAFMLMTEDSLNSEYFEFGRAYQTISFNFYTSENTGTPRIRIVDEVHIPQGDGQWTVIRKKGNHDALPEDYQTYLDLANASSVAPEAAARTVPVPTPGDQSPTNPRP